MIIQPMRGTKTTELLSPSYASPKIDGLRAIVKDGIVFSKTMKPIPNLYVQELFGGLEGADGELVVGSPFMTPSDGPDGVFGRSRGPLMRKSSDPIAVYFCVFDCWDRPDEPFKNRVQGLYRFQNWYENHTHTATGGVVVVQHSLLSTQEDFDSYLNDALLGGYEGMMLRSTTGLYKYGKATLREQHLLKVKPLEQSEAIILSVEEQNMNLNEFYIDELGLQKRSSSKEWMVGKGTFGFFNLKDFHTGVEFSAGTGLGLTDQLRKQIWQNRTILVGKIVRYRYQAIGSKDAPRQPILLGLRDSLDLSNDEL